jgi:hypothetical protein
MAEWIAVGVGPWTAIEVTQPGARFRGRTSDPSTAIAFANDGPMQLELIEAKGEAHSVWHEARDRGRFGAHHIAYWTDEFDDTVRRVTDAGLSIVQDGDGNGLTRFVYVEQASGGIVEIMELTEITASFMDAIRASSVDWDGTRPVRR